MRCNCLKCINNDDGYCCASIEIDEKRAILDAPIADVAPVRHGRWEKAQDMRRMDGNIYDYRCSLCDSLAEKGVYNNYDRLTNYCPSCGAVMDLEDSQCDT